MPTSTYKNTLASTAESTAYPVPGITFSHQRQPSNSDFVSIKVNLDPGRPIGKLSITPATVLNPTSYSSANVQEYSAVPSSPPQQPLSPEQPVSPTKSNPTSATPVSKRTDQGDDLGGDEPLEDGIQRIRDVSKLQADLTELAEKASTAEGVVNPMQEKDR